MRYLIMLEQTETGFAIQVPDLAVITTASSLESARLAARDAIQINLDAYRQSNQPIPLPQDPKLHLENPQFKDFVFAYVEISAPHDQLAA